jgi:hypothetical protein
LATGRTADPRPAIDAALARRLVDTQFPQWAELPLKLLDPAGSDHVIYRLGEPVGRWQNGTARRGPLSRRSTVRSTRRP